MTGIPVAVSAIEQELARIWSGMVDPRAKDTRAVLRARTLNLVVYLPPTAPPVEDLAAALAEFTALYPGRVILLLDRSSAPDEPITAAVQVRCRVGQPGQRHVCEEQIVLAIRREAEREVGSHVLTLLCPELPVFLWWWGDLVEVDRLFRRLSQNADRVVFDSATFTSPESGLIQLAELARGRRRLAAGDLAWTRLEPWRQLVGQFFDTPVTASLFPEIERVRIAVSGANGAPPNRLPALLFAGWLASRLGWERERAAGGEAVYRAADGPVVLRVEVESAAVLPGWTESHSGGLDAVEIVFRAGAAAFAIERAAEPGCVRVTTAGSDRPRTERTVPLNVPDGARLFARQVDWLNRDPIYEDALAAAADLARALGPPTSPRDFP